MRISDCHSIGAVLLFSGIALASGAALAETKSATPVKAMTGFNCSPASKPLIGSKNYHIIRASDGACIGRLSWPVVPNPSASLTLASSWCDKGRCGKIKLTSGDFRLGGKPSRFFQRQDKRASLMIAWGRDEASSLIRNGGKQVEAHIRSAYREVKASVSQPDIEAQPSTRSRKMALADLPRPFGAYALIEGATTLDGLGSRGVIACLHEPMAFVRGRILFKSTGEPIDGNPFRVKRYMECSRFEDGPENCVMFSGTPDAPNPRKAGGGYTYTPILAHGSAQGDFKMCPNNKPDQCALLYACIREDGAITHKSAFPSGKNIAEAMIALADGSAPDFYYLNDTTLQLGRSKK